MKKQNIKKSLAILSIALLSVTACKKDDNGGDDKKQATVVNVPDANLSAHIKSRLGLGASENITTENILQLEKIAEDNNVEGDFKEIANLEGLQHATNLTYIHLGETKVTSLTPVKDLKKVEYFRINDTDVSDLSPLANYTTLTYFNANTATSITDISPISKNTGLQEIILREVPFGNAGMSTFTTFTKLYRLNIRSTGITDVTVLATLMSKGALLKSTAGAAAAGADAVIDLRGNTISNCDLLTPYAATRVAIEGSCQ